MDVNVSAIMVCASLDYFMTLAKFFTEGSTRVAKSEGAISAQPAAARTSVIKDRPSAFHIFVCYWFEISTGYYLIFPLLGATSTAQPKNNIGTLRIKSNIADPEIILPEDMSNPDCNAILVTVCLMTKTTKFSLSKPWLNIHLLHLCRPV